MDVEGDRTFNSQYIKFEEGRLLRDNAFIRERWLRWFYKLLNIKSVTLDPSIVSELKQWPPCRPLDDTQSRYEVEEVIRSLTNRKSVGPWSPGRVFQAFIRQRRIEHSRKVPRYHRRCVERGWHAATMKICND